jgi:predicted glycosyltransferase
VTKEGYLKGLTNIGDRSIRSLLFCGPEMPKEQQKQIRKKAVLYPQVKVLEFTDDLMSYIDAADLVVCMSGYNTICEVLSQGKLAIAVPRIKPAQEQLIRSQRMAELGFLKTIHPDELTPELLIDTVVEQLETTNCHPIVSRLDLNALPRIAESISHLLFESFSTKAIASLTSSSSSKLCLSKN